MNSGLRPIPPTMPVDRAAELMVRRGEAKTFFEARARIIKQRRRPNYGRVEITPADRDATRLSFHGERTVRLPYRDD